MEDGIAGDIGVAGTDLQDRYIFSGFNPRFWVIMGGHWAAMITQKRE